MKHRRFLATISIILALLMALSSTSAAMESAAGFVQEIVAEESVTESSDFNYPNKVPLSDDTSNSDEKSEEHLRLPDVQNSISQEEAEYGKPVLIDEHTKVYQTGERNFKTVYSEIPNTFKNALGKEVEYDNTLVLKEKLLAADYYTATASDINVKLPAEKKSAFGVSFEYDDVKVKMTPTEGSYDKPAVKENAILYNDVFDGIDVQYTVNALGMKEDIILNKCVDKSAFTYKLDVSGAKVIEENGVLNLYKKNSDTPFLTISAPIMTDANGAISDAVSMTFEDDVLTVTAD